MWARVCTFGLIVLLTLGGYRVSVPPPHSNGAFSQHTPPSSDISQALSDLDGDGLADLATLTQFSGRHTLELYLSRTDEWVVLPVRAAVGSDGALSAQDIDGDRDTDLLWQRSRSEERRVAKESRGGWQPSPERERHAIPISTDCAAQQPC